MPPYAETASRLGEGADTEANKRWIRIDQFEYDVTNFKHPGGSIINYLLTKTGADATETFKEFHMRSKKAQLMLKSLPKRFAGMRALSVSEEQMLNAFKEFRRQLEVEGFFDPSLAHVYFRIGELVALFCLGLVLLSLGGFAYRVAGLVVLGLFSGRCGWLQHEGGHNSLTGRISVDKSLQSAFIGFGLGTSASMWNSMHEKHHATPQKIGHDMDLDTTPLAAFFDTAVEKNRSRGASKLWLRFQAYTFLPITSGAFVMLFWLFYLHPRKVIRSKKWEEGFWMLASHIVRPALMCYAMGGGETTFLKAYLMHWVTLWLAGMYLFGHFSLSHTHTATLEADENANWVEFAVHHTVDINPENPLINWVMGYLNCQVIHHLFPNMPQYKQPEVSRRLKRFCKEWGLEYTIISYAEAWRRTMSNLDEVGKHYYNSGGVGG